MFDADASRAKTMTGAGTQWPSPWRMFDSLPTGVCVATPAGRIIYATAHLHEGLGYPYGELEGALQIRPIGRLSPVPMGR